MKFATTFAATIIAAATLSGVAAETNAQRMARGLPPMPPSRRWSSTSTAKRNQPSGSSSNQCNTGSIQCCNQVTSSSDASTSQLLAFVGATVGDIDVPIGSNCSPIGILGSGGNCASQPVCCENNNFNGVVAIGCSPININA